jgi:hypothetical protein
MRTHDRGRCVSSVTGKRLSDFAHVPPHLGAKPDHHLGSAKPVHHPGRAVNKICDKDVRDGLRKLSHTRSNNRT